MSIHMKVIPVPADGDCLYHAFIKGLGIDGLSPQQLRDFVASKIQSDRDLYEDLVTEWVDFQVIKDPKGITPETAAHHIRSTKEWATSTVIHILSVAFNVRILVFQKINGQFYSETFPSEWKKSRPKSKPYKDIYLFRRGYHFELLVPIDHLEDTSFSPPESGLDHFKLSKKQRGGGYGNGVTEDISTDTDQGLLPMVLGITGILLIVFTL